MSGSFESDSALISGVKLDDPVMFQRGLDGGGDINIMITAADPAVQSAVPYPLLVYVLARNVLNKEIYDLLIKKGPDVLKGSGMNYTPLMAAAQFHHNEVFDQLLALGADVNDLHTGLKVNTCYFAARGGNLPLLIRCVAELGQDPLQIDAGGATLAQIAATFNHADVVMYVVEHYGVDPFRSNSEGYTPFMGACNHGNLDLVKYLFEVCKVDPMRATSDKSYCALFEAARNDHLEVVKYLLEVCSVENVNDKYLMGYTAVNAAASKGHLEIVKYLFNDGKADLNIVTDIKQNAFSIAVCEGHLLIVRFLCEAWTMVDLNCKANDKYLSLCVARSKNHHHVTQYLTENIGQFVMENNLLKVNELLSADVDLDISVPLPVRTLSNGEYGSFDYRLPLDIAIENKSPSIIDALWPRVDFFSANMSYNNIYVSRAIATADLQTLKRKLEDTLFSVSATHLWEAARAGAVEIFQFLLDTRSYLRIEATEQITVDGWIVAAANGGSLDLFEQIYAAVRGNLEVRLDNGETLLHLACRAGSVELAMYLLAQKLDINDEINESKESPLCCAVRAGSLPLVQHLIAAGANAGMVLSEHSCTLPGASVLHLAASCNSHEILAWLLSSECGLYFVLELRDRYGWMPIHHAAQSGKVECLRILRDKGVNINAQTAISNFISLEGGNTPLMIASFLAAEESVVYLLECGAEVNYQCGQGYTALYFAIPQQNQHIFSQDCYAPERYERAMRIIKALLSREEINPNLRITDTRFDTRPLDQALWLQHVGIAELLIQDPRVDVNGHCCKTGMPIVYTIAFSLSEISKMLLRREDLMINEQSPSGESPLLMAQMRGLTDLCSVIQAHPRFTGNENPVFRYVRENKLVELRACLESQPDLIELTHGNGETLLYIACSCCSIEMVKLIVSFWQSRVKHWLDNGNYDAIQTKITSRWHVSFDALVHQMALALAQVESAFYVAAQDGEEAVNSLLRQYENTLSHMFPEREEHFKLVTTQLTALAYLALIHANRVADLPAYHQHLQNTLEMLFFNEKNQSGNFPLLEVSVRDVNAKCVECVDYLLSLENVLVNLECPSGDGTLLVWLPSVASTPAGEKILRLFLICPRVDVNKHSRRIGWDGHSALTKALESAASFEHALTIAKLRPDVDVNYRIVDAFGGKSALAYAAGTNCLELMSLMLTFPSVDVNVVDANGLTPLIHASMSLRYMMMELLVADERVDVNAAITNRFQDIYPAGCTALHCAAHGNEVRCLELLYQHPSLVREPVTMERRWTPLMFAALKGFTDSVKWLVAHGADVLAIDRDGMTARLLALQCGRIRIAGFLLEKEQALEMADNEKRQQELTAQIEAFDALQKEQLSAFEGFKESITEDIRELKETAEQHTQLISVLYQDREVAMAERLIVQQWKEAVDYIMCRPQLKAFYNHLQSKLTELFLAYKTLASGAVSRSETFTDTMVGYAINLAGGMVPLVGDFAVMTAELAYGAVRDGREDAIFSFVSSIVVNMDEMTQLVKAASRLTVYKLEPQLEQLDGRGEAESLAECVVGYYLTGLRGRVFELQDDISVFTQLSFCLFKYEPAGMFAYFNETVLKTHPSYKLPKWTARGSLKESGIATSDGVCLAHPKASVHIYGYRFGSAQEAAELGYIESTTKVDPAHPLRLNPYRHKEIVAMPELPPVLTWAVLLTNAKDIPECAACIQCFDNCDSDESNVVIVFKPEVTRQQLLKLTGFLEKQSKQVVDSSIGRVISCKGPKGTTTIVMYMDNETSAELLSLVIADHWCA